MFTSHKNKKKLFNSNLISVSIGNTSCLNVYLSLQWIWKYDHTNFQEVSFFHLLSQTLTQMRVLRGFVNIFIFTLTHTASPVFYKNKCINFPRFMCRQTNHHWNFVIIILTFMILFVTFMFFIAFGNSLRLDLYPWKETKKLPIMCLTVLTKYLSRMCPQHLSTISLPHLSSMLTPLDTANWR